METVGLLASPNITMSGTLMNAIYMLPMILGRSFDVRTNKAGPDIFSAKDIAEAWVRDYPGFTSEFGLAKNSKELNNMLNVGGELALSIKSGMIDISGKGEFLREFGSRDDTVEVVSYTSFTTKYVVLQDRANPMIGMDKRPDLGTHYVSRITYGGELIASLRFKAYDRKQIESIKAAVNLALNNISSLDVNAQGKLDKLQKDLSGNSSLEIEYYGTVPVAHIPRTLPGFYGLIDKFEKQVKGIDEGRGVPIEVELLPIPKVKHPFKKNVVLDEEISDLEAALDELRSVRSGLQSWVETLALDIRPQEESKIEFFQNELEDVLEVLQDTIANLDPSGDLLQFDKFRDAYDKALNNSPYPKKFRLKFKRLTEEIAKKEVVDDPPPPPGIFVHWGRVDCPENARTVYGDGYMATGRGETSVGSGIDYLCLPSDPDVDIKKAPSNAGSLAGVQFAALKYVHNRTVAFSRVRCAVCQPKSSNATSVATLPGLFCPEGWNTQYYMGYWYTSPNWHRRSRHVCMDLHPVSEGSPVAMDSDTSIILPSGTMEQGNSTLFSCTVCGK